MMRSLRLILFVCVVASRCTSQVGATPFKRSFVISERRSYGVDWLSIRGGSQEHEATSTTTTPSSSSPMSPALEDVYQSQDERRNDMPVVYGRVSIDDFRLTPSQIEAFHRDGCVTIPNVLSEDEVAELERIFDRFMSGEIPVPGKDFCDMSKPFGIPPEEWSIVNCMLPTTYYPPLLGNVYERLTASIAQQLFPKSDMVKDYDQLLNKRPGKMDAVFAYHQDIAYWPGTKALGVDSTETCTFSLAVDDSTPENGCLRYVAGSGTAKVLRPHRPLCGSSRDEGHALVVDVDEAAEDVRLAPATRGSVTIHNEWVVHGSSGNGSHRNRRTYVIAYRSKAIVEAERRLGFTHSHNDNVNWDTFQDGEKHRVKAQKGSAQSEPL